MIGLTLPARRAGWSAHPERRRVHEGQGLDDARRLLHAALERLLPRREAHLPPAVAQTLRTSQAELITADSEAFDQVLAGLRSTLRRGHCSAATTGRALGVVGAAMARTLGKTPYDTQYLAAWLILQGRLAEMATGEGKTLAAALAAAVAALGEVPVHVLTANDYLVQRDSESLAPFFAALGLRVGCVLTTMARERARQPTARHHLRHRQANWCSTTSRTT